MKKQYIILALVAVVAVIAYLSYTVFFGTPAGTSTSVQVATMPPTGAETTPGAGGTGTQGASGEETLNSMLQTMSSVKTWVMDMTIVAKIDIQSTATTLTMDMQGSGTQVMDAGNKEMMMDLNMNVTGSDPSSCTQVETRSYLVGGMMYTYVESAQTAQWVKAKVPEGAMDAYEIFKRENLGVTDNVDVKKTGTETISGVATTVIEFDPDLTGISEYLQKGSLTSMLSSSIGSLGSDIGKFVKELHLKMWVDGSGHMVRLYQKLVLELKDIGGVQGTMGVSVESTQDFGDFDKPVSIELPPEAASATEVNENLGAGGESESSAPGMRGFGSIKPVEWYCKVGAGATDVLTLAATNAAGGTIKNLEIVVGDAVAKCDPQEVAPGELSTCVIEKIDCGSDTIGDGYEVELSMNYISPTGLQRSNAGTVFGRSE